MSERSVKLPPPLARAIDQYVKEARDEFGVPLFRSRADFVMRACRHFLKACRGDREEG